MKRRWAGAAVAVSCVAWCGCAESPYDASTPQASLDSMRAMVRDGRPEAIAELVHIDARDIRFADGVTEASAIAEVLAKAGDMLGRVYDIAEALRERFPEEVRAELDRQSGAARRNDMDVVARFLADPFGLMEQQQSRVSVEDLGDGTAAMLIDGKPAFGLGVQMRDIDGRWKVHLPIELMQSYRPDTRDQWAIIANMIVSMDRALAAFEDELVREQFRDLAHAGDRAGRLLGERVIVQAMLYQRLKRGGGVGEASR